MREVDYPHDAEYQGESGGHQKQRDTELKAVQQLFDK
jgi:hypothetical protein